MSFSSRLNILNSKKYLNKYSNLKYSPEGNTNFYLASYTKSVGFYFLKKFLILKRKIFW